MKQAIKENIYFVHPTSIVDQPCSIGENTKIWHFSHVMERAVVGKNCNIGQNVFIASGVKIGNNVKIQNNVSVFKGVTLEDNVFCAPSVVFTNVFNPRSEYVKDPDSDYKKTTVKMGATIGANSTIVCGVEIGQYAFIGAGSVVTKHIPQYALYYGNPARHKGWMCECGTKMLLDNDFCTCENCLKKYKLSNNILSLIT